jgi:hypothetical protein
MVKAVDKQEVLSVADDAPAIKGRKMGEAFNLMHETERRILAYLKLDFPEVFITFNFIYEKTEILRELFAYFFPDSELQMIVEYTNVNVDLQYAQETFKRISHFHGKHWQPIIASELKIWIGILQYMRVHHSD